MGVSEIPLLVGVGEGRRDEEAHHPLDATPRDFGEKENFAQVA
jgi:hypothetical protein